MKSNYINTALPSEESELLKFIYKYEFYIEKFNKALISNYDLKLPPILAKNKGIIPRSGIIESEGLQMTYCFHGIGCKVTFDQFSIDFDYTFGDFQYVGFQISKLFYFIEEYLSVPTYLKDDELFYGLIKQLEWRKIIIRNDEKSIHTYNYTLNKNCKFFP